MIQEQTVEALCRAAVNSWRDWRRWDLHGGQSRHLEQAQVGLAGADCRTARRRSRWIFTRWRMPSTPT
jgi:hypothetical protein